MSEHTYKTCLCEGCKIYRKEKGIPEPVSAYDAEVRRIAEVLAKCGVMHYSDSCKSTVWQALGESGREARINHFMDFSPTMVAEMTSAHYKGYVTGLSAKDMFPLDDESSIDSRNEYYRAVLIRRGLIPAENK